MNGSDWKSDKHPVDKVIGLEAKLRDAKLLIEKLAWTLSGVEVFVKSKEQIKKPEGHEWFDEALSAHAEWQKSCSEDMEK